MKNPAKAGDAGAINVYRCQASGKETWTLDIDSGTTPFIILCRADSCACDGLSPATSAMYPKFIPDDVIGTWEWWKPRTEADARIQAADYVDAILAKGGLPVGRDVAVLHMVEHWRKGGLYLRKSSEPWGPGVGKARPAPATLDDASGRMQLAVSVLAERGQASVILDGDAPPDGLVFKRYTKKGELGHTVIVAIKHGQIRMRLLSRPNQPARFDLFIDLDEATGMVADQATVGGFIDAMKKPGQSRMQFLAQAIEREIQAEHARQGMRPAAGDPVRKLAHDDDGA